MRFNQHSNNYLYSRSAIEVLVIFIIAFAIIFLMMDRAVDIYDEGIILTDAMRVITGDFIHRDFYANYGPGEFYLVACLFKLFGQHIIVERVLDLCVRAGISALMFSSLVYYSRRSVALAATSTCVLWLSTVGNPGSPIYPTLLLTMGSALIMTQVLTRNVSIWNPLFAGILTGLSALFRYDVGFFASVACILSSTLIIGLANNNLKARSQDALKKLAPYVVGAGIPVALIILWYWKNDALNAFLHDVVIFPSQHYANTRSLPFPTFSRFFADFGLIQFAIYMPLIVSLAVVVGFLTSQTSRFFNLKKEQNAELIINNQRVVLVIFFTFLVAMFYLKGVVRVSIEHMQLSLLPSIILFSVLFEITESNRKMFNAVLVALTILFISTASLSGYKRYASGNNIVLKDVKEFFRVALASNSQMAQIERNDIPVDPKSTSLFFVEGDRATAIRFVRQNTSPEQRVFIGLNRHDKVFVNDVSAYFLINRLPVTKWHHFDPGLQTSIEIQAEIIAALEATQPPYIWLESTWDGMNEPNGSAISSGVKILDEYITSKYQFSKNFGQISIFKRKSQ